MVRYLSDEHQKPQNQITEKLRSDTRFSYISSLSNSEYFCFLMSERPWLTIEKLAELTNVSDSLIKCFRRYNDVSTSKKTLKSFVLNGFFLTQHEAEQFFNRYGFTFEKSKQTDDLEFKKKLAVQTTILSFDICLLSADERKSCILNFIAKYNTVTQGVLASALKISRQTINRYFQDLSIINVGSKKKPKWQIKE